MERAQFLLLLLALTHALQDPEGQCEFAEQLLDVQCMRLQQVQVVSFVCD